MSDNKWFLMCVKRLCTHRALFSIMTKQLNNEFTRNGRHIYFSECTFIQCMHNNTYSCMHRPKHRPTSTQLYTYTHNTCLHLHPCNLLFILCNFLAWALLWNSVPLPFAALFPFLLHHFLFIWKVTGITGAAGLVIIARLIIFITISLTGWQWLDTFLWPRWHSSFRVRGTIQVIIITAWNIPVWCFRFPRQLSPLSLWFLYWFCLLCLLVDGLWSFQFRVCGFGTGAFCGLLVSCCLCWLFWGHTVSFTVVTLLAFWSSL